jgi:hypothetical protein
VYAIASLFGDFALQRPIVVLRKPFRWKAVFQRILDSTVVVIMRFSYGITDRLSESGRVDHVRRSNFSSAASLTGIYPEKLDI